MPYSPDHPNGPSTEATPIIKRARELVASASKIVGFSGAGISTESGIPDFRSPDGIWANNRTVYFDQFVANRADRIEYWRQKSSMWPEMRDANPNAGHQFFADLHHSEKLLAMITQNIEGLHQKAGLPADQVIELHGTTVEVSCLSCSATISMDEACDRIAAGDPAPECQSCGGLLKPATISFGQSLNAANIDRATTLCQDCDLLIAVGSSLVVHPAAGFPLIAKQNGAKLIIINRTETPLDTVADVIIQNEIGPTLHQLL
ncbi:MAG: Sir2 family NAD-dependent protein deacetylase [Verrucomicrobiota bacterium]